MTLTDDQLRELPVSPSPAEHTRDELQADIWLFPYLSLDRRERVGPWRLIPRRRLRGRDVVASWVVPLVRGLSRVYEPPDVAEDPLMAKRLGCFVAGQPGGVGDVHSPDDMRSLRRAVTAGLLDGNPASGDRKNAAHSVSTSDNSTLYGHRITPDGHVSAEYGVMVRTLVGGYTIGEKGAAIRPPAELHLPLFGMTFDAEYATAVYQLLRKGDELAARLGRSIDWLDLSWRNTTSITHDVRLVALRSGFEVLMGVGDGSLEIAEALSRLLDPPEAPRLARHWKSLKGKPQTKDLTDLSWWFVLFSFLRNTISHGQAVAPEQYRYEGEHHVMVGERVLRRAIKAMVLPHGSKWLRFNLSERKGQRAVAAAVRTYQRLMKNKRDTY